MDVLLGLYRLAALLVRGAWWLLASLFGLALRTRPNRRQAHGSAQWASTWSMWRGGAFKRHGLILGKGPFGRLIRFTKDGLVMVFANTGTGKGLGVVVPNLLTYPGSMVVTDPKGENYAITQRHRRTLGKVRMLAPLDLASSDHFNPMDIIRRGTPMEADDAAGLARLMVKPDADWTHWDDKAVSTLRAYILHTLYQPPETRSLATVRTLSVGSAETFLATLEEIAEESPSLAAREIASGIRTAATKADGSFSEEYTSVISNVQKATEPWGIGTTSGQLAEYSSFALDELTEGVSTLYICVPEEFLDDYGRWMRVMVGCVLKILTRQKERIPKHKVVLLLDEVRVLGRLESLETQAGLLRAYTTPVLIWQNMPQIHAVYREGAEAFMATATCRVFFGTEDPRTGEYVSAMVGNTTTLSTSTGTSQSSQAVLEQNRQFGQSESGYWLIDPAEVQGLPLTKVIIKMRGVRHAIMAKRLDYRKVLAWRGRWDRWRSGKPKPPAQPPAPRFRPAAAPPEAHQPLDNADPVTVTGMTRR